jgi:NAD(P)H dehydrogenase (quinone)
MILLTGAAGKTGQAILKVLQERDVSAMPLVRTEAQAAQIRRIGDFHCLLGDLRNLNSFESQLTSIDVLYYICPNIAPDELEIGKNLIQLAKQKNISRFIYHSVLHPQIESMPHHWQKMRMEEALLNSELGFTILQPCAYMQNVLGGWDDIKTGRYITPYQISSRISMVDLQDVAAAAARVMTQTGFENAIFELAGPESLMQIDVARYLSQALKIRVVAEEQSRDDWKRAALSKGMQESQAVILLKMFEYYDKHGLVGNPDTLQRLLGHSPTSFSKFLERILVTGEVH